MGNDRNNWRQDNYSAENAANRQAGFAEKARQEADKHAQAAADIYDKVKHL